MYIYKSMDDGLPVEEESEKGDNMRIIEVDGKPTSTVGIRYTSSDTGAAAGIQRTKSGRFVDTTHPEEKQTEYWADIPSGFMGGQRFRTTTREDLAVRFCWAACSWCHLGGRHTFGFCKLVAQPCL